MVAHELIHTSLLLLLFRTCGTIVSYTKAAFCYDINEQLLFMFGMGVYIFSVFVCMFVCVCLCGQWIQKIHSFHFPDELGWSALRQLEREKEWKKELEGERKRR